MDMVLYVVEACLVCACAGQRDKNVVVDGKFYLYIGRRAFLPPENGISQHRVINISAAKMRKGERILTSSCIYIYIHTLLHIK